MASLVYERENCVGFMYLPTSFDWLIVLFLFFVIGQSDYFRFGFNDPLLKTVFLRTPVKDFARIPGAHY